MSVGLCRTPLLRLPTSLELPLFVGLVLGARRGLVVVAQPLPLVPGGCTGLLAPCVSGAGTWRCSRPPAQPGLASGPSDGFWRSKPAQWGVCTGVCLTSPYRERFSNT